MGTAALILAAGKGTRFGDPGINKTACDFRGKSLVQTGVENISQMVEKIFVVVGYKKESVIDSVYKKEVIFIEQKRLWGTGWAVKTAISELDRYSPDNILVANGDHLFMINPEAISKLIMEHARNQYDATILTAVCDMPQNLSNGRILREQNTIVDIIEKGRFNEQIRRIKELNSGTYIFKYQKIREVLRQARKEKGKELYLTDLLFRLGSRGTVTVDLSDLGTGVNTRAELESYRIVTGGYRD